MRKLKIMITAMLLGCVSILTMLPSTVFAADFEGNEEEWLERCSIPQETQEAANQCAEFKTYYAKTSDNLSKEADDLDSRVASVKGDISKIQETINQQNDIIKKYEKQIQLNDASISKIKTEIAKLTVKIKEKEADIKERNDLIMERMVSGQSDVGTNINIEIIMGASDLVDLIRKVEGIQKITEADQTEIDKLKEEKEKLDLQKQEQGRLKEDEETKKKDNETAKQEAEAVRKTKNELLIEYQKKEADLNEKMRNVKADISSMQDAIININTSVAGDINISSKGSFLRPVNGPTSAGTWSYPGGGVHLGWDIGVSVGTSVYAPANGIILFASNPAPSNGGYLGNTSGWPTGGGNTIHLLTQVEGTTYGISFFHLSQEGFAVSAGQQVTKGQRIALTGHSGNSTGPHCHIEVINLGTMSVQSAISQFQSTADFAWGCGWGTSALSRTCGVSGAPCRERPENIFG